MPLQSRFLKEKQKARGIKYVALRDRFHDEFEIAGENGEPKKVRLPVRVALEARPTEYWIKNRPSDQKFGGIPRKGAHRVVDDPDVDDERTQANYQWMKKNVMAAALGVNDYDPETGEEVWHRLELFEAEEDQDGWYDEDTDTVHWPLHRFDEGYAVTHCHDVLVNDANYGGGVGEQFFRPFVYGVAGANGRAVR